MNRKLGLLNKARKLIPQQTVRYYRSAVRTTNEIGYDIADFDAAEIITGSFQPVARSLYVQYGLDLQKNYANFYTKKPLADIGRDTVGDELEFNGKRWKVESANDWTAVDDWTGVLCVAIRDLNA